MMTAPLAWQMSSNLSEPLDRLRRQRNWIMFILNILGQGGELGQFRYNSLTAHLLSAILSRTTGMSAREFANEYLFKPLGMRQIQDHDINSYSKQHVFGKNINGWIKDPQGITVGGWGLCLTPRDMARFGLLYLSQGLWDKQQVVSSSWVIESTTQNENNYGYLWWLSDSIFAASGYGGNHIFCVPEKDICVAIASKLSPRPWDRWQLLERYILSASSD